MLSGLSTNENAVFLLRGCSPAPAPLAPAPPAPLTRAPPRAPPRAPHMSSVDCINLIYTYHCQSVHHFDLGINYQVHFLHMHHCTQGTSFAGYFSSVT